jgi:hypothetical protein
MNSELGEKKRVWPVLWQCGIWLEKLSIATEIQVKLAIPSVDVQNLDLQN